MSVKLKQQKTKDFNQDIQDVFHTLSISSKFELVGSSSYKDLLYNSDYDLTEAFKAKDTRAVLEKLTECFQEKFKIAKNSPDEYITDFKCGEIDGEPIRWNYKNMMNGYQTVKGKKIEFEDCLLMNSIVKLDMVVFINEFPNEFSNFYVLNIGNNESIGSNWTKQDVIKRLEDEYKELVKEKNYFKALKRLFSVEILKNKPSAKLLKLFNSDLGRLYKTITDLNIIILLLDQSFKHISLQRIRDSLQMIKQFASKISSVNVQFLSDEFDNLCTINSHISIIIKIEIIIVHLNDILNRSVKPFIKN